MPVTHHRCRKINHAFRHTTMREEISRKDEERDSHDFKLFNTGKKFECHRLNWYIRHREQKTQYGQT